ncbi:MAG TPA: EAL domain-containing protein, partial [Longimicrobium sp.]|nr:EAL domain-containing protein [Longimicrobium sp.]
GAATTFAFVATPDGAALRHFVRVGVRSLLVGLAFLVGAAGVWPTAGDAARVGRRLVAAGFVLFGAQQLHYFGITTARVLGWGVPGYVPLMGIADLILQWTIGLGMVMCLLEEERFSAMRAARRAEHLAYHDALTGLPNRRLLRDHLELALAQARRTGGRVAVVFLDLDRFKVINDSLGHGVGDRLLDAVGDRIRHAVRAGDTLARIGGDEFTLLLPAVADPDDAGAVARKVVEAVRAPFTVDGHELFVTASAGISVAPDDGADADTLLKHADVAMYRAKEAGSDSFAFFAPEMNARAAERLALESALRRALPAGQLRLLFQPVFSVETGRPVAAEALLRWAHPERGVLAPDAFLGVAEATGLIVPIGAWVLREACACARRLRAAGAPELAVLVNLSARQLAEAGLVEEVRAVLVDEATPPHLLELEITESLAMREPLAAEAALRGLRALGVRISVDDFGTGYSSFGYLRRFPVDTLKIDRSFVRDVDTDEGGAAIAAAIIAMGQRLGLRVVAEGVEREGQLAFLRAQRCDAAQGFHLGRPVPAEALEAMLRGACAGEVAVAGD